MLKKGVADNRTPHTCNEHFGVVRFREGHGVEAGVRRHLPRGEADVAHSHRQGLAAAPRGAEQGLLGHLAEGSDNRHDGTCRGKDVFIYRAVKFHRHL